MYLMINNECKQNSLLYKVLLVYRKYLKKLIIHKLKVILHYNYLSF